MNVSQYNYNHDNTGNLKENKPPAIATATSAKKRKPLQPKEITNVNQTTPTPTISNGSFKPVKSGSISIEEEQERRFVSNNHNGNVGT